METKMKSAWVIVVALNLMGRAALADEEIVSLANGGNWSAVAHHTSMTSAPDVCIAANGEAQMGFRADEESLEIRVSDRKWSLPSGVSGNVEMEVGEWTGKFDITGNTDTTVEAVIPQTSG